MFYEGEIEELLLSITVLVIILSIVWIDLNLNLLEKMFVIIISALFGFVGHELAHKFVAQSLGYTARFTADILSLAISFLISLSAIFGGIVVFAPGAVFILDEVISLSHLFWITAAGPIFNIISGIFLLIVSLFYKPLILSAWLCFWLALFNLIPLFGLDGEKLLMIGSIDLKYGIIYGLLIIFSIIGWLVSWILM
jgi:Zn-dependent protease